MGQITDNLKEYFKTHTKEEVLKDWENTLEDEYNSITVNKFLTESKKLNEQTTKANTSKANLNIPVVSNNEERVEVCSKGLTWNNCPKWTKTGKCDNSCEFYTN